MSNGSTSSNENFLVLSLFKTKASGKIIRGLAPSFAPPLVSATASNQELLPLHKYLDTNFFLQTDRLCSGWMKDFVYLLLWYVLYFLFFS